MRLTLSSRPRLVPRLAAAALALAAAVLGSPGARGDAPSPNNAPPATPGAPPDPLGNLVVTPGATRPLPRIAIVPSLSSDLADVIAHSVVERDLDLCGEFELLPRKLAPADALSDSPIDMDAWTKTGVAAVVNITATTAGDKTTLTAAAYLPKRGATPVLERKITTASAGLRGEAHRTADILIGALTGQNGGFYSHMTFTSGAGPIRMAHVVDSDGHDARAVSKADELVIASAFGKNEELYWVSSVDNNPYRIRTKNGPVALPFPGSVYGLAFSKDRSRVAVSISTDDGIRMFSGKDFASLQPVSTIAPALEPTFTPDGKVAFAGAGKYGFRIYADGQPITPEGAWASSPTFCNHPDGVRAVFAAGFGRRSDLYSTGPNGGPVVRLTQGGVNSAPACSPDGRLVAFFSTRASGDGPGLYIMRVDGRRPKRISTLVGSALRWDPLPPPAAATPAPAAQSRR